MINERIKAARESILAEWLRLILETYPPDARGFLGNQRNRFLNPIGAELRRDTTVVFDVLAGDAPGEKLAVAVDNLIAVRAVQDFTPSQAVAIFYLLKDAVRVSIAPTLIDAPALHELANWEKNIDLVVLRAFDAYMARRDKLYEIKANNLKRQSFMLQQRSGIMAGADDDGENGK